VLEHVERRVDALEAAERAAEQADRRRQLARANVLGGQLAFRPRELEPQLRGLVDGLEEQLVVVRALVLGLLQREQLVGAEVALVVRSARRGKDRGELVLGVGRRRQGRPRAYFRRERPLRRRRPRTAPERG